jgi:hypothetical protein
MEGAALQAFLQRRDLPALLKALDDAVAAAGGGDPPRLQALLYNRAVCLHQLGLSRKALKVGFRRGAARRARRRRSSARPTPAATAHALRRTMRPF